MRVQVLSLPTSTATPFQSSGSGLPISASIFIGVGSWVTCFGLQNTNRPSVLHPVGNVAEFLVAAGLARVVDWHAGMLASSGTMERLRAAEKAAKEKRAGLYANTPTVNVSQPNGILTSGQARAFDGTVVRIWSGDQLSVAERDTDKEHRLQLSSTRAPKYLVFANPPTREPYPFTEPPILNKHVMFMKQETFYEKS